MLGLDMSDTPWSIFSSCRHFFRLQTRKCLTRPSENRRKKTRRGSWRVPVWRSRCLRLAPCTSPVKCNPVIIFEIHVRPLQRLSICSRPAVGVVGELTF